MRISPLVVLFFLLVGVPLLEIYLLISLGRIIGAGATIAIVVATAVLGTWLLRLQGLNTLARVRAASEAGQVPAVELVEGLILLVAGVLLLTPGFFTDAVGFLLLVPPVRKHAAEALLRNLLQQPHVEIRRGPYTIEGDYRREDPP